MQPPDQLLKIEPCEICGDIGFEECIATCIKCKVTREHCYCMQIYTTKVPVDWICESCQSNNGTSACKVDSNPGWKVPIKKRPAATGKVKFIPEDEVIKLSSGNFPMNRIPAKSTSLMNRKPSVRSKKVISKIPSPALNSNPRPIKKGPRKEHIQYNQQLLGRRVPDREVQAIVIQKEKPMEGGTYEAMSEKKSLPNVGSGDIICSVADCDNIKKSKIQIIQGNLNLYRKFLPTATAAWSGCFAASGNYYGGFQAHPPCTVNIKAYNISKRMPPVLQLESLPSLDVFTDLFQDDWPTLQDIALYFFPSERSRNDLNSIFEFMDAEKSMLRGSIDGVELLVFTSNHLNIHSRGTIAALHVGCFLWGIFRQRKKGKATTTQPVMEDVDMDVDMIGGKDVVGRIDHFVNDKSRSVSQSPVVGTHLHTSSQKAQTHRPRFVMDISNKINKSSYHSSVEKRQNAMDKLDVPPGFEAHGKYISSKLATHEKKLVLPLKSKSLSELYDRN